jgi:hypothetical protein
MKETQKKNQRKQREVDRVREMKFESKGGGTRAMAQFQRAFFESPIELDRKQEQREEMEGG